MQSDSAVREPLSVLAVVVTRDVTAYLPTTLAALAAQTASPAQVAVAVTEAQALDDVRSAVADAGLAEASVVPAAGARTFGAAVRAVLADRAAEAAEAAESVWLLHDDSAPTPRTLESLNRAIEQGSSVTIAGPKQVEWDSPDRLVSVGLQTTRRGRRFSGLEDGEIDQGQHDHRSDVLGVGTAGMLIRRETWDALGGTDPELGPFGDGLDLSRRARLAGHRVVVVPDATVRHARASLFGTRLAGPSSRPAGQSGDPTRSWAARREAQLYGRLVGFTLLGAVAAAIWMVLAAPVRALGRVATKELALVGPELRAPFAVLTRLGAVRRARGRERATAVVPRRALRSLYVTPGTIARTARDARLARAAVRRASRARSELEIAEAAALARRRRVTLAVLLGAGVAVALVVSGAWLGAGPLVGGSLLPVDATWREWWETATATWLAVGAGHPGMPEPFGLVLAALTTILGGPFGVAPTTTIAVLGVGAVPLAALGAWFAAGAATRSVLLRAWAAAVWALAPPLLLAVGDGRIGAVVAHLALPWVALGTARALGVQRRDVIDSGLVGANRTRAHSQDTAVLDVVALDPHTSPPAATARPVGSIGAAAAAGIAFAVACAGAPMLLPVGTVILVATALVLGPRRRGRHAGSARLALVPVPALALLGPWLSAPILAELAQSGSRVPWEDSLRLLVSEPGLAQAASTPPAWQVLLGWPDQPWRWPSDLVPDWIALVASGILVLAAVVALTRGGGRARAVRIAWLSVAIALAAAVSAPLVAMGLAATRAGEVDGVTAWIGPATSVVVLGLLIAAVTGGDGAQRRLGLASFGWRQGAATLLAVLVVAAPVAHGATWIAAVRTGGSTELAVAGRGVDPVPALGRQLQASGDAARVLALAATSDGLQAQVWRGNGPQLLDASASTLALRGPVLDPQVVGDDAADASLAQAIARLTVSADEAAGDLADHAIAVVVVPALDSPVAATGDDAARAELVAALDATAGLERVTENDAGVVWRVEPALGAARLRLLPRDADGLPDAAAGSVTVPSVPGALGADATIEPSDAERLLVLAERADPFWQASVDGVPLATWSAEDGSTWSQAFVVPAGASGALDVRYDVPWRLPALVGQIGALVIWGLLALPTRRRRTGMDT